MDRRITVQSISWFWDAYNRGLFELDPPYQRRSVWNQEYKDYFIDTVLNDLPAPAVFLFRETTPEGVTKHSVVDGKQRLSTIFEFANNEFPVSERATISSLAGLYFQDLPDANKTNFWNYQFTVEFIPSSDEKIINNIFDRINRNVAKLSAQELRHARFEGDYINSVEDLNEWASSVLPPNFPQLAHRARKQMKDVEFAAQLVLYIEEGPRRYKQLELDEAFSKRDESWSQRVEVEGKFREVIACINRIVTLQPDLARTRLKNIADFYSVFGAIYNLDKSNNLPEAGQIAPRLADFVSAVEDIPTRESSPALLAYFNAVRSSSSDVGKIKSRIDTLEKVITGRTLAP